MCHHLPVFSKQSTLSFMMQEAFMATSGEGEAIDLAAKGTTSRNCCGTPTFFEGVSIFFVQLLPGSGKQIAKESWLQILRKSRGVTRGNPQENATSRITVTGADGT